MITFFAPGIPKAQPRPRAFARKMGGKFVARVFDAGTAEAWKSEIAVASRGHCPTQKLTGPIRLTLSFYLPRPKYHIRASGELKPSAPTWNTSKPDCDNYAKAVMDCLTVLGFWEDDAQVVDLSVTKCYGPKPGCEIRIADALLILDGVRGE